MEPTWHSVFSQEVIGLVMSLACRLRWSTSFDDKVRYVTLLKPVVGGVFSPFLTGISSVTAHLYMMKLK